MWAQMQSIEDPELKELADSLPEVVLREKAPSTAIQWCIYPLEEVGE